VAARHPFLDWPGPIALAHRGGALEAPENTAVAFANAVELGYTFLETDVRATTDGVVAVFHDADLERTTGRAGRIGELTWPEVAAARVAGTEPIPRLDEVLAAWPEARFNIDCKADSAVDPLVDVLRRADALDRVCIGTFNQLRLMRLRRRLGPAACTITGPLGTTALRFLRRPFSSARAAQIPVRQGPVTLANRGFVDGAHRRGLHVHVWTIDDADEMRRLLDLGVDGIMTDRPSVLRDVLIERDVWY
jgi:glycerophosphoryl diester phosphodiesterase